MTESAPGPEAAHLSPRAIRTATFSARRRGWDVDEVREFLGTLADQIESADAERATMRAEIDRLRAQQQPDEEQERSEVNTRAVALFSQAQQVADRLVSEAVEHARDVMSQARAQQREILERAHQEAAAAARELSPVESEPTAPNSTVSEAELEYVRTFAHVAQVQLRSVLDALTEQVDRLGQVSQSPIGSESTRDSSVSWQIDVERFSRSRTQHHSGEPNSVADIFP